MREICISDVKRGSNLGRCCRSDLRSAGGMGRAKEREIVRCVRLGRRKRVGDGVVAGESVDLSRNMLIDTPPTKWG